MVDEEAVQQPQQQHDDQPEEIQQQQQQQPELSDQQQVEFSQHPELNQLPPDGSDHDQPLAVISAPVIHYVNAETFEITTTIPKQEKLEPVCTDPLTAATAIINNIDPSSVATSKGDKTGE